MITDASGYADLWKTFRSDFEVSGLNSSCLSTPLAALIYLRWVDFQEAEIEAIAAFDDTDYSPVLSAWLHWRSWHAIPPEKLRRFFQKQIGPALERLDNSHHRNLATHLHRIAPAVFNLALLPSNALGALIQWVADQPFETPADRKILLGIFDSMLDRDNEKESGEFRTPDAIVRLMVELAAPVAGERMYDPCLGVARLLTTACDYASKSGKNRFSRSGASPLSIFGVEKNPDAYLIGLTRLALAGIDDPQIELGDSLERPAPSNPQRDGFDLVLANPPWGWRTGTLKENRIGRDHYPFITQEGAGLFVQHALQQLRPNGRAVVVVPEGLLFRVGKERDLRRYLLEHHTLESVISLPAGVLIPYSGIKASILVFRRGGVTKQVRMADAAPLFPMSKGRKRSAIQEDRLAALSLALRSAKPEPYCWDVDAASLADVEWDLTPKRRDRSELDRLLDELRDDVEVVPLKTCCRVMSGRRFRKNELRGTPLTGDSDRGRSPLAFENDSPLKPAHQPDAIPLIRIQDIQKGQAVKGSSWLDADAASTLDPRWKLKAGDILLSKSGTIGKAGIVRNGGVGAVAAGGLFVLRPESDRLDPHFLWAYLESHTCRTWLDDRARGATVLHLSKSTLDEMPVPLPPLPIQQRAANQYREQGADVPTYLVKLLIEGEDDPLGGWIDEAMRFLESEKALDTEDADVSILMHSNVLGARFSDLRNRYGPHDTGQHSLASWVAKLGEAVDDLRDAVDVPHGPAYYSLLQQASQAVVSAGGLTVGNLPTEKRARELNNTILEWLERSMATLAGDVRLSITTNIDALSSGGPSTVEVDVRNLGALPLRDVSASTKPDWGDAKIGYLPEREVKRITFSGVAPNDVGPYSLQIAWKGLAFDGRPVNGESEVAFNLAPPEGKEGVVVSGFGGSPYVCGDPVRPERGDVFFGREALLDQIRRQVIQTGNVVLLEGNRRAGKSSILWHLAGPHAVSGWLGAYCSLQGAEGSSQGVGVPTVEVFREMASSVAKAVQAMGGDTPLPDGTTLEAGKKLGIAKACREGIGDEAPFSAFREYAEMVLEWLDRRGMGLLLMLDEFDKLQEGIDSGVTSPQVPENIRFLVHTYPRFSAILTGSRRLKRLREEYWSALYGIGTRFGVSYLPINAARRLVIEPVRGRMTYTSEAIERAIQITAGQPYLLQCLCNRVFDMAAQLKIRSVNLDLVNRAGDALVKDNEHFASLWDYAETDRRRFILTLCHKAASGPDPFQLGVLQEHLSRHGIEVDDELLIRDLEFLQELELVELVGSISGGRYKLSIPLMGTWIERQQDMTVVLSRARMETED